MGTVVELSSVRAPPLESASRRLYVSGVPPMRTHGGVPSIAGTARDARAGAPGSLAQLVEGTWVAPTLGSVIAAYDVRGMPVQPDLRSARHGASGEWMASIGPFAVADGTSDRTALDSGGALQGGIHRAPARPLRAWGSSPTGPVALLQAGKRSGPSLVVVGPQAHAQVTQIHATLGG